MKTDKQIKSIHKSLPKIKVLVNSQKFERNGGHVGYPDNINNNNLLPGPEKQQNLGSMNGL